jgi:hypothetical protein
MLLPDAIARAVRSEIFRVGSGVNNGGISFPGGKAPTLQLLNLPDQVSSLVSVLAEASALASQIMKTGRSTSGRIIAPVEGVPMALRADRVSTPAETRLAALLAKQADAALDLSPDGEKKYHDLIAEIAIAQSAMSAGAPQQ